MSEKKRTSDRWPHNQVRILIGLALLTQSAGAMSVTLRRLLIYPTVSYQH